MLYIVATPIGNYADITLRALDVLKNCDIVIGEEYRIASTFLKKVGLPEKEILLLNEHAKEKDIRELVDVCASKNVALISDCGTPGFADPGAALIKLCRVKNIAVTALPGPSSLMTILSLSSQKSSQFLYIGFLPANKQERIMAIKALKTENKSWVLMDTPYRLKNILTDLASEMPNERGLLGVNLTQESELIIEGTFKELLAKCRLEEGEFIILRYAHTKDK
ncbi:MAG: 16S rRNA (cytidine(1402)-2'-O)-methyltransferase [Bdellovibrionales bacterium RBG_16_40_8]|nr:MAG: 16S rRNA (cytidine(1402)-2'-O)-methyltransferase [Bdellovibrionales bacterium RBG_16_40_8]